MRRFCVFSLLVLMCLAAFGSAEAALTAVEPGQVTAIGDVFYVVPDPEAAAKPSLEWQVRGQQLDSGFEPLAGLRFAVVALSPDGTEMPYPDPDDPSQPWILTSGEAAVPLYLPKTLTLYLRQLDEVPGYQQLTERIPLIGRRLSIDLLLSGGALELTVTQDTRIALKDAQGSELATYAPDAQGQLLTPVLPEGQYTLEYVDFPEDMLAPDPLTLTVKAGAKESADFLCVALPHIVITVEETAFDKAGDLATQPLSGVRLLLHGSDGAIELITGEDGIARAEGAALPPAVQPGDYRLVDETGVETAIRANLGEDSRVTLNRHDGNGQLKVQAWLYESRTAREPLSDASLHISGNGQTWSLSTDDEGMATLPGLSAGSYALSQALTAEGVALESTAWQFEIAGGEETMLVLTSGSPATIVVSQQGITLDAQGVPRLIPLIASYSVYDAQGNLVSDDPGASLPASVDGTAYVLREREANPGFVADGQAHEVIVYPGETVALQTLVYSSQGYFTLEHVSEMDGALVAGGAFALYDASGALCLRFEADAQGRYASVQPLWAGEYTLVLEEAAEGYMAEAAYQALSVPLVIPAHMDPGQPVGHVRYVSVPPPEAIRTPDAPTLMLSASALHLDEDQTALVSLRMPEMPLSLESADLCLTLSDETGVSIRSFEVSGEAAGASVWLCEGGIWREMPLEFDALPATWEVEAGAAPITALRVSYRSLSTDGLAAGVDVTVQALRRYQGDATLEMSADGTVVSQYRIGEGQVQTVAAALPEVTQTLALQTPGLTYHGIVFEDYNQNGIQDADEPGVYGVEYRALDADGKVLESAWTDVNGGYVIEKQGYASLAWSLEALHARSGARYILSELGTANVALVRSASLIGRIDGAPERLRVSLWNPATGSLSAQTDADGSFIFEELLPDEYTLSVQVPDGYMLHQPPETIALPYGETVTVELLLARVSGLTGQVRRADTGHGVEATVILQWMDGAEAARAQTDAQGAYHFPTLYPGTYTVTFDVEADLIATWGARTVEEITLMPGETAELSLAMTAPAALEGTLQGLDRTALDGLAVSLMTEDGQTAAQAALDAKGRFAFDRLPPMTYTLDIALPDGYVLTHNERIVLQAGETLAIERSAMKPARISGVVWLDVDNGAYLDDADEMLAGVPMRAFSAEGTLLAETVTNKNGGFELSLLPPGEVILEAQLPQGTVFSTVPKNGAVGRVFPEMDTRVGRSETLTLLPGEHRGDIRVGAVRVGTIDGVIWQDLNDDGLRGATEPLLEGVQVTLSLRSVQVAELTTGADGRYAFETLRPGSYTVELTLPEGWVYAQRVSGPTGTVSHVAKSDQAVARYTVSIVSQAASDVSHAIGALPLSTITGKALLIDGEPLPGMAVRLLLSGRVAVEVKTDASGEFILKGLRPGDYQLRYVLPSSGYVFSNGAAEWPDVHAPLAAGKTLTVEAPEVVALGTLSGVVFGDANDNSLMDAGEAGLSGTKVTLWQKQTQVAAVTTTRTGRYQFEGLMPGIYRVVYELPDRYVAARGTMLEVQASLTMGAAQTLAPVGGYRPATLSGIVWLDEDVNGRMGGREPKLEGVVIGLLQDGERIAQYITDKSGQYLFEDIAPGTYTLEATLPDDLMFANDGLIAGVDASVGQSDAITLDMGMDKAGQNIGAVAPGELYGVCWLDSVYNGLLDDGEARLEGVMVSLLDANDAVVRQLTTGADGSYSVQRVRPGQYRLHFVLPEGMMFSLQAKGGSMVAMADVRRGFSPAFILEPAQLLEQCHAAAIRSARIVGEVFVDVNDDGLHGTDENGLAGAAVQLLDANGRTVGTAICGLDGIFAFDTLRPGAYTLSLTLPEGYITNTDGKLMREIALAMGEETERLSFGGVLPGIIEGRVFEDLDADGFWGEQDPGMPGVQVTLIGTHGSWEAVTDENGTYCLEGVRPGNYRLRFTLPTGYLFTEQRLGGSVTPALDANEAETVDFTLAMGETLAGMSAGALRVGRVGDRCWIDANGNGMQDDDEEGIANLEILVERQQDGVWTLQANTLTDADGYYWFEQLRPGTYRVRATCPEGYWPTMPMADVPEISSKLLWRADAQLETDAFPVRSGQAVWNQDMGFVSIEAGMAWGWYVEETGELVAMKAPEPTQAPASRQALDPYAGYTGLIGLIWLDDDMNGSYDPGEPLIEGVQVALYQVEGEKETLLEEDESDAAGVYLLAWLPEGEYRVLFTLPEGLAFGDGLQQHEAHVTLSGEDLLYLDQCVYRHVPSDTDEAAAEVDQSAPGDEEALSPDA